MSTPKERIEADLKAAMKQRDTERLGTLRMLLTAVKNRGIEIKGDVDEDELVAIVRKQIKQRQDSIEQYRQGGREELAAREEAEIAFLEPYMPEQVGEEEIRAAVTAFIAEQGLEGPQAMGQVMKAMIAKYGASADGSVISRIAKETLIG